MWCGSPRPEASRGRFPRTVARTPGIVDERYRRRPAAGVAHPISPPSDDRPRDGPGSAGPIRGRRHLAEMRRRLRKALMAADRLRPMLDLSSGDRRGHGTRALAEVEEIDMPIIRFRFHDAEHQRTAFMVRPGSRQGRIVPDTTRVGDPKPVEPTSRVGDKTVTRSGIAAAQARRPGGQEGWQRCSRRSVVCERTTARW